MISAAAAAAALTLAALQGGFPAIETETLSGEDVSLPGDLPGPTLMLVGFEREHEDALLEWVESMGLKEQGAAPWRQFTVLGDRSGPVRWMIDNWMKVQIGEKSLRRKTLMVYRDKERMAEALGLGGTGQVAVLAVSPAGEILATAEGAYDEEKARHLRRALESRK